MQKLGFSSKLKFCKFDARAPSSLLMDSLCAHGEQDENKPESVKSREGGRNGSQGRLHCTSSATSSTQAVPFRATESHSRRTHDSLAYPASIIIAFGQFFSEIQYPNVLSKKNFLDSVTLIILETVIKRTTGDEQPVCACRNRLCARSSRGGRWWHVGRDFPGFPVSDTLVQFSSCQSLPSFETRFRSEASAASASLPL